MARRRNPPRSVAAPMSYAELVRLATQLAGNQTAAERAQIERERSRADDRASATTQAITGYDKALGGILSENAREFGGVVDQAQGVSGALAKGYADALKMQAGGTESAANAALGKIGAAPLEGKADAAGEALFGLAGTIPGRSFAEEGAAMKTTALNVPNIVARRGSDQIARAGFQAGEQDEEFAERLIDLAGRQGGVRQELLLKLLQGERDFGLARSENARANRAAAANERYTRTQIAAMTAELTGEFGGKLTPKARSIIAEITGYDPITGKPTAATTAALTDAEEDAAGDAAANRAKAISEREDAFAKMTNEADLFIRQNLVGKKVPNPALDDPGLTRFEKSNLPKEIEVKPEWGPARKALFDFLWPQVSRYASGGGKEKLRRRLYEIVDKALTNAGITKKGITKKKRRQRRGGQELP